MIKIANKIFALYLTFALLLSTCGVVFYYHVCTSSKVEYLSIYIDTTEEQCAQQEMAMTCGDDTNQQQAHMNDNCCAKHNVQQVVKRLSSKTVLSAEVSLPDTKCMQMMFCISCNLHKEQAQLHGNSLHGYEKDNPKHKQTQTNYGHRLVIKYNTLKLYA